MIGVIRSRYQTYYAFRSDTLAGAIGALSSSDENGRTYMVGEWGRQHADLAHLRQLLDLSPEQGGSRLSRYASIDEVWKNTPPEGRQALFDDLAKLDTGSRNDVLSILAWKLPKDDPALLVKVMDQMASFDQQRRAISIFSGSGNWQAAQSLVDYIDAMPDPSPYARIRAYADRQVQQSKPKG